MIGKTLGHYQILEELGHGGMGEVFLAYDTHLKRKVALKFLKRDLNNDPAARKRLLHEARSAALLDHPFICKIYQAVDSDEHDFIAMEYLEGETLRDALQRGPLPPNDILRLAVETAEALEVAHEHGVVHRDLKPANIMLGRRGHVKVMDFGLAKRPGLLRLRRMRLPWMWGLRSLARLWEHWIICLPSSSEAGAWMDAPISSRWESPFVKR